MKPTKVSSCSCALFRLVIALEFSAGVLEGDLSGVHNLKRHQNGPWGQVFSAMLLSVIMHSELIQPVCTKMNF